MPEMTCIFLGRLAALLQIQQPTLCSSTPKPRAIAWACRIHHYSTDATLYPTTCIFISTFRRLSSSLCPSTDLVLRSKPPATPYNLRSHVASHNVQEAQGHHCWVRKLVSPRAGPITTMLTRPKGFNDRQSCCREHRCSPRRL